MLIMINGERLNEISFGKALVYTPFIPASIVQRIEFIRGPGSALYGSNAFLGVMNILTEEEQKNIKVTIGNNNLYQLASSWYKSLSDTLKVNINLALDRDNGQVYYVSSDQIAKDPLKSIFFEFKLNYKNLKLSTRYNKVNLDEFINLSGFSSNNQHESQNAYLSAHYRWWQDKRSTLSTKLLYGEHQISSSGMVIPDNLGIVENEFLVGPFWKTKEINLDHQIKLNKTYTLSSDFELRRAKQSQAGINTSHFDWGLTSTFLFNSSINESYQYFYTSYLNYKMHYYQRRLFGKFKTIQDSVYILIIFQIKITQLLTQEYLMAKYQEQAKK
nr:TonB-dependent receptor plug domain-containing protein [Pseudoalteromonas denitrificans]